MYEQLYAENHFDVQNVGVMRSLLLKSSGICSPICMMLIAQLSYSNFGGNLSVTISFTAEKAGVVFLPDVKFPPLSSRNPGVSALY